MTNITLLQSKTLPDSYLQQLRKCFQATFSHPQVTSSLSALPAPGQPKVPPEARGHEATSTGIGRASDCHGPVCQVVCCQTRPDRLAADSLQTVCEAEGPCLWSFWMQPLVPAGCLRVTFSQSGTRSVSKFG